jgi:phosphoglucosamine mutase
MKSTQSSNGIGGVGMRSDVADAVERYVDHLADSASYSLGGAQLALDCANGSAFRAAPLLFERLGADIAVFAAEPNGTNINDKCGATHPEYLAREARGRLGLAFDGDADRLIAIDENGVPANGDVIMAVIADHLMRTGELTGGVVVVTVMSNLGFRLAMERIGVEVVETAVGDRYVLEAMRSRHAVLGGEQSGHVILADRRTGDGLATGMKLLEVMAATGKPLTELREVMTDYPQVLRNVRVDRKDGLDDCTGIWDAVRRAEHELAGAGRVLVRPSGTEPLVRVMVEAATSAIAAEYADRLVDTVCAELGAGRV